MSQVTALDNPVEDRRGERRERLRDFQSQLLERMQGARAGGAISSNHLGIMIGQDRYLLNLREAGEIVSLSQISPVPLTRDWYLGLLNLRGNLVGVVDIQRFRGLPKIEQNADCRVIVFSSGLMFNAGLLVSKVLGLRNAADMTVQSDSPDNNAGWLHQRYLDNNNQIWHELSLATLIQDGEFLHIGA